MQASRRPACGIVGAGRTRNGLGPFLARALHAAGADVVAIAGRDQARTQAVADGLGQRYGHPVVAYTEVASMLASTPLEAIVIASPIETHESALQAALASGVHALCEKPLVAPGQHQQLPGLLAAFEAKGLTLMENCIWPYVLHALPELHPQLHAASVARVEMLLAPSGRGRAMLVDSLSHLLSVLQHLVPVGPATGVLDVVLSSTAAAAEQVQVTLDLKTPFPPVRATLYLDRCERQPRPAWIAVNGRRIDRHIRSEDYAISFVADGRSLAVEDPLVCLVRDFVQQLREPDRERARHEISAIRERARIYQHVLDRWPE